MKEVARLRLPFESGQLEEPQGEVLFLNAAFGPQLFDFPSGCLTCEQGFLPELRKLTAGDFRADPVVEGRFDCVMVQLARNRVQSLGLIARGWSMLSVGGTLIVNGSKHDGIDAIRTRLRKWHPIDGAEAKAHGKILWLRRTHTDTPAAWRYDAKARENDDGFLTAPGMFSWEAGDAGSKLLAGAVAGTLSKRAADLGAGYGYLARNVLAENPKLEELVMIEADHAAWDVAKKNVSDPRATVLWDDATRFSDEQRFDVVLTNPPFHIGRLADPGLGQAFLENAARILAPRGTLLVVANRQLPYEKTLAQRFREWSEIGGDTRYKLFRATGPKTAKRSR